MIYVLIGVSIFLMVVLGCYVWSWRDSYDNNYIIAKPVKLKFKMWLDIYRLNSDKWQLFENYPAYYEFGIAAKASHIINFNFIDFLRYKILSYKIKKQKEIKLRNHTNNVNTREFISAVQHDIDRIRKQAAKEQNQAAEIIIKVNKNLKGEF